MFLSLKKVQILFCMPSELCIVSLTVKSPKIWILLTLKIKHNLLFLLCRTSKCRSCKNLIATQKPESLNVFRFLYFKRDRDRLLCFFK